MNSFLISIFGVLIGVTIFFIVAWLYVKNKISKMAKELANALGSMQAIPPFKITLREDFEPKLKNQQNFFHCQRLLNANGFKSAGTFSTDEIKNLTIEGFIHQEGFMAALYDHPKVGVFVDLVALTQNNHWYIVSSNSPQGINSPENCTKTYLHIPADEDKIITDLISKLKQESEGQSLHLWNQDDFRATFEEAYNAEMQWRIHRGGVTDEEIYKVAELTGLEPPDEEILELVKDNWKIAIIGHIDDEVKEACLQTISMPIEEWEDKRERLFIIHSYSNSDNIACDVTFNLMEDEEENDNYEEIFESKVAELKSKLECQNDMVETFEKLNKEFPEKKKFKHLCNLKTPYKATVFISPKMRHNY